MTTAADIDTFSLREVSEMTGYSVEVLRVYIQRYNQHMIFGRKVQGKWRLTLIEIDKIKQRKGKRGKDFTC